MRGGIERKRVYPAPYLSAGGCDSCFFGEQHIHVFAGDVVYFFKAFGIVNRLEKHINFTHFVRAVVYLVFKRFQQICVVSAVLAAGTVRFYIPTARSEIIPCIIRRYSAADKCGDRCIIVFIENRACAVCDGFVKLIEIFFRRVFGKTAFYFRENYFFFICCVKEHFRKLVVYRLAVGIAAAQYVCTFKLVVGISDHFLVVVVVAVEYYKEF